MVKLRWLVALLCWVVWLCPVQASPSARINTPKTGQGTVGAQFYAGGTVDMDGQIVQVKFQLCLEDSGTSYFGTPTTTQGNDNAAVTFTSIPNGSYYLYILVYNANGTVLLAVSPPEYVIVYDD